ncbi:MAG: hypothetical protein GXX79_13880 [Actinomycetales bacterium]|nr:hypothetical protein [Actinomycetales bacterium]
MAGPNPVLTGTDAVHGGITVKKALVAVLAIVAGYALWRKVEADKREEALWAEVTDPVE